MTPACLLQIGYGCAFSIKTNKSWPELQRDSRHRTIISSREGSLWTQMVSDLQSGIQRYRRNYYAYDSLHTKSPTARKRVPGHLGRAPYSLSSGFCSDGNPQDGMAHFPLSYLLGPAGNCFCIFLPAHGSRGGHHALHGGLLCTAHRLRIPPSFSLLRSLFFRTPAPYPDGTRLNRHHVLSGIV